MGNHWDRTIPTLHKGIHRKCHQGHRLCVDLMEEEKTECKGVGQQAERCWELELSYGTLFFPHFPPVGPMHKFPSPQAL